MDTLHLPRVIAADRIMGDLLIAFDDNRTALFSAAFLYGAIPHAQEVLESGLAEYTLAEQSTEV